MKNRLNKKHLLTIIILMTGLFVSTNLFPQEDFGQDPLYRATIKADINGVKKALADGADINRQSENGYTSLLWACTYSQKPEYAEVAKFLISAGADLNIRASDGTTAIMDAAESSAEITRLLLEKGADINIRRNDGRGIFTSVIFGILMGNIDIEFAEFILLEGADVNEAATSGDTEGWAGIHYAVSNGKEELVRFLVKNGANVHALTKEGLTPLSLAESNEYAGIIKILKDAGAK